jgi:hypothetical protein
MRLFQISSSEAIQAVYAGAVAVYDGSAALWVDGRNSPPCAIIVNTGGGFTATSSACASQVYSVCETFQT